MRTSENPAPPSLTARWRTAPLALRSYLVFAVAATLFEYGLYLLPWRLHTEVLPYTGHNVAVIGYSFSLYFAAAAVFKSYVSARASIVALLSLSVLYALMTVLRQRTLDPAYLVAVPYAELSPYHVIWTIIIPVLWIAVLFYPRVTAYLIEAP